MLTWDSSVIKSVSTSLSPTPLSGTPLSVVSPRPFPWICPGWRLASYYYSIDVQLWSNDHSMIVIWLFCCENNTWLYIQLSYGYIYIYIPGYCSHDCDSILIIVSSLFPRELPFLAPILIIVPLWLYICIIIIINITLLLLSNAYNTVSFI